MSMTRDDIRSAAKRFKTKLVKIDGLGDVYIREVTAKQYNRIMNLSNKVSKQETDVFFTELAAYFLSDEDGHRLFNDTQISEIADLNGPVIKEIVELGLDFNGMGKEETEELEKNSEPTQ